MLVILQKNYYTTKKMEIHLERSAESRAMSHTTDVSCARSTQASVVRDTGGGAAQNKYTCVLSKRFKMEVDPLIKFSDVHNTANASNICAPRPIRGPAATSSRSIRPSKCMNMESSYMVRHTQMRPSNATCMLGFPE